MIIGRANYRPRQRNMLPERPFIPCRSNEKLNCPEYPNCRTDKHHIYGRVLLKLAIEAGEHTTEELIEIKRFIEDERNHVESCRDVHARVLDRLPPFVLPPI